MKGSTVGPVHGPGGMTSYSVGCQIYFASCYTVFLVCGKLSFVHFLTEVARKTCINLPVNDY